jgi:hypothetical protein
VNIKPDIRDTIPQEPSPMHDARYRPIRCNPRYLRTVRRVAPSQADMWSSGYINTSRSAPVESAGGAAKVDRRRPNRHCHQLEMVWSES